MTTAQRVLHLALMSLTRAALVVAPLVFVLGPIGCAVDTDDDGDTGDEITGETADALSAPCAIGRSQILASVSGGRATAIRRGLAWYDANVPYSQTKYYAGYRTDCSGFVSMAWQLETSYTTASFATGGGESFPLGSYDALEPGDALVRRANGAGHMVMFLGWNDAAHRSACVVEQNSTALDMELGTRTTTSLRASGYKPIRADKFAAR